MPPIRFATTRHSLHIRNYQNTFRWKETVWSALTHPEQTRVIPSYS